LASAKKYTSISVPVTLHKRIKGMMVNTGFKSVSDYATYVLREVVVMHETERIANPFTTEDVEKIKTRLKALGYI